MIQLAYSPVFSSGSSLRLEIETLQPKRHEKQPWVDLMVRYYINEQLNWDAESSLTPPIAREPVEWLDASIKLKGKYQRAEFRDGVNCRHEIVLEQNYIEPELFSEIQAERGGRNFAYPFMYDITVLVNPDPEAIVLSGISVRFSGFSYSETRAFFSKLHEEVKAMCQHDWGEAAG